MGETTFKVDRSVIGPYSAMILLFFIFLLIIFLAPSSSAVISFTIKEDPTLEAVFYPQNQGWLGADVSVSFPLSNSTYLWLWGDTLVGNLAKDATGNVYRNATVMPHSSLAFVDMAGNQKPNYYIKMMPNTTDTVDPMGLFRPQNPTNPSEYYWTVTGIVAPVTKNLVVIAQTIIDTTTGLGFEQLGTDVILVSNPLDPPASWIYLTSRIPSSSGNLTWNSGITFTDGYFFLVGLSNSHAYLARITEKDLMLFNWKGMQYWSTGDNWASDTSDLLALYPSTCTEGTLLYHPYLKSWYVVLAQAYQGTINIAYAPEITGPYTVQPLYTIPKNYQNSTVFAYAAKSHPEYANPHEIVFTYNVNCNSLSNLAKDMDIYHPKFIRAQIVKQT